VTPEPVPSGFALIPAGSFMMGSPPSEVGRNGDEAQAAVTLTRAFYLETAEVTQGQWKALSGGVNPSDCSTCGDSVPVESVSWWSTIGYLNARSTAEGLSPCYTLPGGCTGTWQTGRLDCGNLMPTVNGGDVYTCSGYRLPTEAEWEYAARAGTTAATYGGNLNSTNGCVTLTGVDPFPSGTQLANLAWYTCNSGVYDGVGGTPQVVRGKAANAWGLYDMLGNIFELTWDRHDVAAASGTNAQNTSNGVNRVIRGGSYGGDALNIRGAYRNAFPPGAWNNFIGFRAARTAPSGFITVQPGTFVMGSSLSALETVRTITLTRGFFLGVTEVTQGFWKALSGGSNPSKYTFCGDSCPVEDVSWWSALGFLNALSTQAGYIPCYIIPSTKPDGGSCTGEWQTGDLDCGEASPFLNAASIYDCEGYRLPTEAEWEYAARAGTTASTYAGEPDVMQGCATLSGANGFAAGTPLGDLGWYFCNNEPSGTKAVAGKAPNAWGFHDMLGNVREWTNDWFDTAYRGPTTDPTGASRGQYRVHRGGSFSQSPQSLRAAARGAGAPSDRAMGILGFRIARTVGGD
jgi:sulfatase modifying factor 1